MARVLVVPWSRDKTYFIEIFYHSAAGLSTVANVFAAVANGIKL